MSDIRTPRSTRTPKSLEALSASLNRALAGARGPQVVAARRAQMRQMAGAAAGGSPSAAAQRDGADDAAAGRRHERSQALTETLASRQRTNMLIGTLDRLRRPATGWRAAGRVTP